MKGEITRTERKAIPALEGWVERSTEQIAKAIVFPANQIFFGLAYVFDLMFDFKFCARKAQPNLFC